MADRATHKVKEGQVRSSQGRDALIGRSVILTRQLEFSRKWKIGFVLMSIDRCQHIARLYTRQGELKGLSLAHFIATSRLESCKQDSYYFIMINNSNMVDTLFFFKDFAGAGIQASKSCLQNLS